MKAVKRIVSLLVALMVLTVPITVSAVEDGSDVSDASSLSNTSSNNIAADGFALTVECKLDGKVPENTEFVFSVTEAQLIFSDDDDSYTLGQEKALNDFTVNTKDNTDGKKAFTFPDNAKNGGYYYSIKLKSCSNKLAVSDAMEVHITFFSASAKTEIIKNGEPVSDDSFDEFAQDQLVTFNCITATAVNISTEGCEAYTKVYDGKLTAAVSEKNYKLIGIAQDHEVALSFGKAEFDSKDVKNATKVTLSGLKLSGKDAEKYILATDRFELKGTITPRPLTVTADSLVVTAGDETPALTYKLSEELAEGDSAVGSLICDAQSTVGTYSVTRGTLSFGDNYEVTFVEGTLTVSGFDYSEIKDPASSVTISGYFDPNATLKVTALDPDSEAYSLLAAGAGWGRIISSYDIVFTANGLDGSLAISIPVDSKYEGKEIAVYQKLSNGSIACFKSTAIGGTVTIASNECTQFMLVADTEKAAEDESSVGMTILKIIIIILAVIIGLALVIALFFFGMIFFNKTEQLKSIIRVIRRLLKK